MEQDFDFFWQLLFWLYAFATLLQLAAWWGIFWKLGSWKNQTCQSPIHQSPIHQSLIHQSPIHRSTDPPINRSTSILLCARNEAENLRRHLPDILAQQFDGAWELLVIDDASEDETPAVLHSFQEKYPERLRVLRIAGKVFPGKKHALAQGIAIAKHDLLLLTDADCKPASPQWLAQMIRTLTAKPETEIALGYGSNFPTGKGEWPRYETAFVAAQYFSFALVGMPYMGVGRNLAFRREVFERAGGFSAHAHIASGDDDLLVNAAANAHNTVICLAPESFVYSAAPANWAAWFRQKRRHLSTSPAYRWRHKIALAALAASQAWHYFLFALLLLLGFSPIVVVGIFALRMFSVLFVFGKILRVLREPDLNWRIPLHDALLAVYYGAVVPWFLLQKKPLRWRS